MVLRDKDAGFFFGLGLAYLAALLALAVLYNTGLPIHGIRHSDIGTIFPNGVIANILPMAVPLFGALGAVTISLYGVFEHANDWDRRWNYWHAARPLVGAVLGIVGYFMFIVAVQSTNTKVDPMTAKGLDLVPYYVLAFVVGYREETFRQLIKRFVDLILTPSQTAPAGSPVAPPKAVLLADSTRGKHPLTLAFDFTGSTITEGEKTKYKLDFGDGTPVLAGEGIPERITHRYEAAGSYTADLSLQAASGHSSTASFHVDVD